MDSINELRLLQKTYYGICIQDKFYESQHLKRFGFHTLLLQIAMDERRPAAEIMVHLGDASTELHALVGKIDQMLLKVIAKNWKTILQHAQQYLDQVSIQTNDSEIASISQTLRESSNCIEEEFAPEDTGHETNFCLT